jgi:hypothetical protein
MAGRSASHVALEPVAPVAGKRPPLPSSAPSTPDVLEPPPAAAPARPSLRWAALYTRYFGPGTDGSCASRKGCHAEAMGDADAAYRWLAQRGYIAGSRSPLVSPSNSCLRWFGGNMPPRGAPNDSAVRDLEAWVAAGARNDDAQNAATREVKP